MSPGPGPPAGCACRSSFDFVARHGAAVLNPAYPRCWELLESFQQAPKTGLRVTLVGLGDVGGAVLTGLVLLGREIDEIRIFDPNEAACRRYELEMNQILSPEEGPRPGCACAPGRSCFAATSFCLPPPGAYRPWAPGGDVRMQQFQANRAMLRQYARLARQAKFRGLFCQISDPVDHLCRAVFLDSNRDETGRLTFWAWRRSKSRASAWGSWPLGPASAPGRWDCRRRTFAFTAPTEPGWSPPTPRTQAMTQPPPPPSPPPPGT